jgi:hypothetical protein
LQQEIFNPNDITNHYEVIGAQTSSEHNSGFVAKSGAATGYTSGNIINTHVTIIEDKDNPSDGITDVILHDQVIADYTSAGGDSGSPIFSQVIDVDENTVNFYTVFTEE